MPHGNYATCPQCGITAYGYDEIEMIFGFRYGGTKPQSWCKSCRNAANYNSDRLGVGDAAEIWLSHGMDEDYTFGYTEDELRNGL